MSGNGEENNSVTSEQNQQPADIFKNNHDLIGVEGMVLFILR